MHNDDKPGKPARPKQSPAAHKKAAPASARKPEIKRKGKKPQPVRTVMKLGKSIATGGTATIKYTRRAMGKFNDFTQNPEGVKTRRRFGLKLTFPLFIVISVFVLGIALMALDNGTVKVDQQTISVVGLNKDLEGYTILHISDLHGRQYGTKQASLLRSINAQTYNLALFTGDMVGKAGDAQPFYDLLEGLTANRPRYFIAGDSDPDPVLEKPREITGTVEEMVLNDWVLGAKARGCEYLSATTQLEVGTAKLWLSPGTALNLNLTDTAQLLQEDVAQFTEGAIYNILEDRDRLPIATYRLNQMLATQAASAQMKPEDIHIALSHMPPTEQYIAIAQELGAQQTRAYLQTPDLVLCGHYCGGGWRLPFYGALYIPNTLYERHGWFPAQSDVAGLRQMGATLIYTSPGLGMTDRIYLPSFRLFNSPKITLITLTAKIQDDDLLGG